MLVGLAGSFFGIMLFNVSITYVLFRINTKNAVVAQSKMEFNFKGTDVIFSGKAK